MKDKKTKRREAATRRELSGPEASQEAARELPNREALSLVNTLPTLPTGTAVPPELLAGDTTYSNGLEGTTIDQTTSEYVPADATTIGTVEQQAPANEATAGNVESSGTTETASATQVAPVNERS